MIANYTALVCNKDGREAVAAMPINGNTLRVKFNCSPSYPKRLGQTSSFRTIITLRSSMLSTNQVSGGCGGKAMPPLAALTECCCQGGRQIVQATNHRGFSSGQPKQEGAGGDL